MFSDGGGRSADIPPHVKHKFTDHREQPAGICNVYSSPDYAAGAKRKRTDEGAPHRVVDVWKNSDVRIGISGWTYPPWRGGTFYPKGWPQKRELEYASWQVNSIEINGSFYSLHRPESYQAWYNATPEGFLFSVKGGRFITHFKRLKEVETPLANFFGSSSSLRPQSEKRIGNRVKVALLPLAGGVYQSVRSERRFAFPNCLKNPANSGPVPTAKSPHQSESRLFPHYRVLGLLR